MALVHAMPVLDPSHVGERRRQIGSIARLLGFDETEGGRIAIAVTEIATNLIKHAGEGELLARPLADGPRNGLEVLALDKGRGIPDIPASMRDGYSTAGSPGTGMGAIRRMADQFDLYSSSGGSVIMIRFWAGGAPPPSPGAFEIEGLAVPKPGEEVCGDDWACHQHADTATIVVADGLGHGPSAAAASGAARQTFESNPDEEPGLLLGEMHGALRSTRGAAAAIARIDHESGRVRYVGVGNITGTILASEKTHRMVSHNGIVGHEFRRVQEFIYPWTPGSVLMMASDGLLSQWSLDPYPGLLTHHLSVVAGVLYRDFSRGRDDSSIVLAREARRDAHGE